MKNITILIPLICASVMIGLFSIGCQSAITSDDNDSTEMPEIGPAIYEETVIMIGSFSVTNNI